MTSREHNEFAEARQGTAGQGTARHGEAGRGSARRGMERGAAFIRAQLKSEPMARQKDQRLSIVGENGVFLVTPAVADSKGCVSQVMSHDAPEARFASEKFWAVYRMRSTGSEHQTDCDMRWQATRIAFALAGRMKNEG